MTFTTEEVLSVVVGACRANCSPMASQKQTQAVRMVLSQAVYDLTSADPETPSLLRKLAVIRLHAMANDDPRAETLADDPNDPYHHEFLLVLPDVAFKGFLARALSRMKNPGNGIGEIIFESLKER